MITLIQNIQQNTFLTYIYMYVRRACAPALPLKIAFVVLFLCVGVQSASAMTLSGTLYSDQGVTAITSGKTINVAVGTTTTSIHSTTSNGSGVWSVNLGAVSIPVSTPITIWVDGDVGTRAALFTKASSTSNNIPSLDLYQNRVIVSHEGTSGTSTTISNMSFYDFDNDSDIQFTAATSSGGNTLMVFSNQELYIKTGKTFAPGGNVVINANASTTSQTDGNFHLAGTAIYTAGGLTVIGGNYYASSTATVNPGSYTTIMNASTTGKVVNASISTIGNIYFNQTYDDATFTFVGNATTSSFGIGPFATVTAPSFLTIQGNYANAGGFINNGGTVRFATTTDQSLHGYTATSSAFSGLTIGGSVGNTNNSGYKSVEYNNDGNTYGVNSFAVDTTNNTLYLGADAHLFRCPLITKCDSVGDFTDVASFSTSIYALTIDSVNGVLYIGTGVFGILYRCLLSTGCDASGDFTTAFDTPEGGVHAITIDTTNGVLYAGVGDDFTDGSTGVLYRCLLSTGCDESGDFTTAIDTAPLTYINAITLDPINNALFISASDSSGGILYRCLLSTGCDASGDFTIAYDLTGLGYYPGLSVIDVAYAGMYFSSGQILYHCFLSTGCDASGDFTTAYNLASSSYPSDSIRALTIDSLNGILYFGTGYDSNMTLLCVLASGCTASSSFYTSVVVSGLATEFNLGPVYALMPYKDELLVGTQYGLGRCSMCSITSMLFSFTTSDDTTVTNALTIESGATFTNNSVMTIGGNYTNNGTSTPGDLVLFSGSSAQSLSGTMTGTSSLPEVLFTNTGTKTFSNNASTTGAVTINAASTVSLLNPLSIKGDYTNNGTFSASAPLTMSGAYTNNGTFSAPPSFSLTGNYTNNGIFTNNGGSFAFNGREEQPRYRAGVDANGSQVGTSSRLMQVIEIKGNYLYAAMGGSGTACTQTSGQSNGCELMVYDISSSTNPTYVAGRDISGNATGTTNSTINDIEVSGNYLYLVKNNSGTACSQTVGSANGCELQVYDISSSTNPTYVAGRDSTGDSTGTGNSAIGYLEISGNYLYLTKIANATGCLQAAGSAIGCELQVYDISTPTNPTYVAGRDSDGSSTGTGIGQPYDLSILNGYLYIGKSFDNTACSQTVGSANGCELQVYDISSSTNPTYVAGRDVDGNASGTGGHNVYTLSTSGNYLYLGIQGEGDVACIPTSGYAEACELQIYDISSSSNPVFLSALDAGGDNEGSGRQDFLYLTVLYNTLYVSGSGDTTACSQVAGSAVGCELKAIDVADPVHPKYMGGVDSSGSLNGTSSVSIGSSALNSLYYLFSGKGSNSTACSQTADQARGCELMVFDISGTLSGSMTGSNAFNNATFTQGVKFSANASTSNFTIGASSTVFAPSQLTISGNYTNNGTFYAGATTTFSTTTSQTLTGSMVGTSTFNNVLFTGAGTKTFGSSASTTNFIIESGSTVVAPSLLTIGGDFRNSGTFTSGATTTFSSSTAQGISGTLTAANGFNTVVLAGTSTKTFGGNASTTNFVVNSGATAVLPSLFSISGNYTNGGTTTAGSGTTTFNGTSVQVATGTMTGTSAFYNLAITNTSGAGSTTQSVIFGRPASTTGTFSMIASTSAQFLANSSSTFQNINLRGASGQYVWLRSSVPGTQYGFSVPGTQEVITYVDVRDNNACSGTITATDGTNLNSGNNSCWTFTVAATNNLTLSGTLYSDEGVTVVTSAKTLNIAVGTTTTSVSATSTRTDGTWSFNFTSAGIATSTPITMWIDGDATFRAALFTKASSTNSITGLDLYQNRVIVSHEGTSGTSTTIANMSFYDNDNDSDIQYTAATTTNTLTVFSNQELHIKTGKTFAPGGNVTVNANASTTSQTDGNFHIANSATYTAGGTTMLGGNFMASSSATFTPGSYTTIMNATTTGKVVYPLTASMGNMLFTSATGSSAYSFTSSATTTNFYISTNATVTAPTLLTVEGDYVNAGGFVHNSGTVRMASTSAHTIAGVTATSSAFNSLVIDKNGVTNFAVLFSTATMTAASTTVATTSGSSSFVIDQINRTLYVGGSGSGFIFRCDLSTKCDSGTDFIVATNTVVTSISSLFVDRINRVLYAGSSNDGLIFRCDLSTNCDSGTDFTVATDTAENTIYTFDIDETNGVLFGGGGDNRGSLFRCVLSTGCDSASDFTTIDLLVAVGVQTISIDQVNGVLYVGDGFDGSVHRCILSTGCDALSDFTTFDPSTPFFTWRSSVIDKKANILYVGNENSATLIHCILSSGCDEPGDFTLAADLALLNSNESAVRSLAIDETNGILYAITYISASLYSCILSSGCDSESDFSFATSSLGSYGASVLAVDQANGVLFGPRMGNTNTMFRCVLCQSTTTNVTTVGGLTIGNGSSLKNNQEMRISGNYTNNGTSSINATTTIPRYVFSGNSAQTISGTLTGTSSLPYVTFTGSGTKTFSSYASTTGDVTIGSGSTVSIPTALSLGRNLESYGTINNSGTLYFNELGANATGTLTGTGALGDVSVQPTSDLFTLATDTAESFVQGLAIDPANQVLYAGTSADGLILRCVLSTSCDSTTDFTVATNTGTGAIHGMIVDPVNQVLYAGSGSAGWIFRCALSTGCDSATDFTLPFATSSATLVTVRAFTIDTTNQVLYAGTGSGGIILRCALSTGCDAASEFTIAADTTTTIVYNLAFDATNGVLYLGTGGTGIVLRCVVSTNCDALAEFTTASDTPETTMYSTLVDSANDVLYVGSGNNGRLYRCPLATGCDSTGDFLVALDGTPQIMRSLVIDTTNNILYVGSQAQGAYIYRCKLSSQCDEERDFTSNGNTGEDSIYNMVFNPVDNTVYAAAGDTNGYIFRRSGVFTFGANASTSDLTIGSASTLVAPTQLTIGGNYTNNGIFSHNGGVVTFATSTITSSYTGAEISPTLLGNSVPVGIAYKDGYFYTTDNTDALIYKYPYNGFSSGGAYKSVITAPYGIAYAQEHFWIVDATGDRIYKYTAAGTSTGFSFDTSNSGNGDPADLDFVDGYFWVTDSADARVYKYSATGTYTGTSFDTAGSGSLSPTGIEYVNGYFYIADDSTDEIYVYTTSGTYTGTSFDTAGSGNGNPAGMTYAYGLLWVTDYSDGVVYKYSLGQSISGTLTGTSTFNNLVFSGASPKAFANNASTTHFTIATTSGEVSLPQELSIAGNYINSTTTGMRSNNGVVYFASSSAQTLAGVMIGSSAFATTSFLGSGTKTFSHNASTTSFVVGSSSGAIIAPPQLTVMGNFTNNSTFTAGTGTTTLGGYATQTLSGTMVGSSAFNNLQITNTSGLGSSSQSVRFVASASTTDTFSMIASTSVQFLAGATSTFQNIKLTGASGQKVYLRSSTPGTQYGFYVPGTQKDVSYVDVRDSSACPTLILATNGTDVDSGNNTCWTFAAANATIVSDAHQVFAYLQATTTISPITITEDASSASITAANDIRLIIATSTTNMRWDTTDVTPTFAGTASGKVAGTVSYAGDGAILIIDVTSDFAPGDTLGVSNLSYARFETVSPATVALGVRTAGAGTSTNNSDSKTVTITGTLSIGSHTSGQIDNVLTSRTVTAGELLAFKLTPAGETIQISNIAFPLKGIQGIGTSELANVSLYRDMNSNQAYDAGDVAVGGTGSVSLNGQTGSLTFSQSFNSTTTQDYLLIGDIAEVMPTDAFMLALSSANLASAGATSLADITESGSINDFQHIRGGQGAGGGGGAIGGNAPAGDGVRTGGGGGGGEDIDPNSGTTIGHEVGFRAPSTDGGSWTNGSNAYTSDGAYATANSSVSHGYGLFGFSVPSNNQVTGIVVKLEASGSTAAGTISVLISWDGGSSFSETKTTSAVGLTDAVFELGSPSDTWGRSWSPSELNDGNLVVAVVANPSSNTLRIDAIQIRVYHQATGGGGGGGGAVFKEPNRFFANVYSAFGDIWEESVRSFLSWLRIE